MIISHFNARYIWFHRGLPNCHFMQSYFFIMMIFHEKKKIFLRIINETIGTCGIPRVGWQIDPFGHSKEHANILAQLGFDAVIFARLDHDDKDNRRLRKASDFAWQGNAHLGMLLSK